MANYILCPNDWKIKTFIPIALAVVLLNTLMVTAGTLGIDIPFLRPLVAFIFLTFLPGILILRILRVHNINPVESVVYSAGLSLAFTMLCGTIINFTLPLVNLAQPLQVIPVTVTLCVGNIVLIIAAYIRDRAYLSTEADRKPGINIVPVLFLLFLLCFLILGVMVNNATDNNLILLLCIGFICLVMAAAAFNKFILPSLFPLAIFIISLCLLFQTTLMSPYLVGTDIYTEYQVFQQVYQQGIWNYAIPNPVNSCLSIAILGPVYAHLMSIDSLWVFKVIYPFIFSFVPLALFRIFRIQFGPYRALFACFLFMAVPTFSLEMISLCRQQVAELFFVLIILLLVERKLKPVPKLLMFTVFILSILISHYSLGIISLIYMVALIPLIVFFRSTIFLKSWGWLTRKTGGLPQEYYCEGAGFLPLTVILVPVSIFIVFIFIGYSFVSSGINLDLLINLWARFTNQLSGQIGSTLSSPLSSSSLFHFSQRDDLIKAALGLDFLSVSWQGKVFRILQYITQIFIALGLLRLLFHPRGLKIKPEYIVLSFISVLLLIACVIITGFADRLNTTRWYHLTLIMLAPFCILGGEAVWQAIKSLVCRLPHISIVQNNSGDSSPGFRIAFCLIILVPYFVVASGFLYEITGQSITDKVDTPYSIALSSYRIDFIGIFTRKDGVAALWLSKNSNMDNVVFTDYHAQKILTMNSFPGKIKYFNEVPPSAGSNLFFTNWNTLSGELTYAVGSGLRRAVKMKQDLQLELILGNADTLYVNSGAEVLLTR